MQTRSTHTAAAQRERIVLSLEYVVLILLTVACLNSSLKRDEVNSLYEDNKTGRSPRPGAHRDRIRSFLRDLSHDSESVIIQDLAIRSMQLCCIKSASIPSCNTKNKKQQKKQQKDKNTHSVQEISLSLMECDKAILTMQLIWLE